VERFHLRSLLDAVAAGSEESTNGSLSLERESFFVFFVALFSSFLFLFLRTFLPRCADHRLNIPRFRLCGRAGTAFFSRPELK
jgi:hypothetical protein